MPRFNNSIDRRERPVRQNSAAGGYSNFSNNLQQFTYPGEPPVVPFEPPPGGANQPPAPPAAGGGGEQTMRLVNSYNRGGFWQTYGTPPPGLPPTIWRLALHMYNKDHDQNRRWGFTQGSEYSDLPEFAQNYIRWFMPDYVIPESYWQNLGLPGGGNGGGGGGEEQIPETPGALGQQTLPLYSQALARSRYG